MQIREFVVLVMWLQWPVLHSLKENVQKKKKKGRPDPELHINIKANELTHTAALCQEGQLA